MERPGCVPGPSDPILDCFHLMEREKNCPLLRPSVSLLWGLGEDAEHLGQRRPGSFENGVIIQAPDGVRDPGVGVIGYPSHTGDCLGGYLELLGDDDRGGYSVQLQFYTVVQTALAAGASVPDGEYSHVAFAGYLPYQFGGCGAGGVGLGVTRNPGGLHLRCQQGR